MFPEPVRHLASLKSFGPYGTAGNDFDPALNDDPAEAPLPPAAMWFMTAST